MTDMNPMELLKTNVSALIVNDKTCLMNEKNDILSRFYPILLYRFLTKPQIIDMLKEMLVPTFADLLERNDQVKNALLIRLSAGKVSIVEAEITLNRAIPKSLAVLSNHFNNDTLDILYYLRRHRDSIESLLPIWSGEVLQPLYQVHEQVQINNKITEEIIEPRVKTKSKTFPYFSLFIACISLLWIYQLMK
ncbi:hypothetical protein ACG93T_00895 [Acinetobacter beijerinckii]|uniref:hypothetical protein n=1 Tax=Acinetobacter TaxID=469 RepID=UPI0020C9A9BE|nr:MULTISPECIES: hypothetical protein [Acinetobacter]UTO20840.1 hypothetical protein NGC85_07110 [Acinetobacter sp. Z1]